MTSKHTPGPWTFDGGEVIKGNSYVNERPFPHWQITAIAGFCNDNSERIANGNLIAAAPELLDALVMMIDCHDRCVRCEESINDARKIIAKATGGTE